MKAFFRKSRKMRQVIGVSFPRSGHHIIYRILKRYHYHRMIRERSLIYRVFKRFFDPDMLYCDSLGNNNKNCGCGKVPCINKDNNFSKNHDFDVLLKRGITIEKGRRYLIQYRNPVRSIASNYYLHCQNYPDYNSLSGWKKFSIREIKYWKAFVSKWVIEMPGTGAGFIIIPYDKLMTDPVEMSLRALQFSYSEPIYLRLMFHAIKVVDPSPKNSLANFPHYDENYFYHLESLVKTEMDALGLSSFKNSY